MIDKFLEKHRFLLYLITVIISTIAWKVIGFEIVVISLLVQLSLNDFWNDIDEKKKMGGDDNG